MKTAAVAAAVLAILVILAMPIALSAPEGGGALTLDTALVESITGLKGAMSSEEGVFKVTAPREDVAVLVDGARIHPFRGLASWAAFQAGKASEAMVMGDLVLFEDEVNPVLSALLESSLSVTALHNHFFFAEPPVYFLHIGGEGGLAALSTGVRRALDTVAALRARQGPPTRRFGGPLLPEASSVAPAPLEAILGVKAQAKDGMLKFVIGRRVKLPCGCDAGKDMGVNTWAAFAGTDTDAVADGDFAVLEDELQAVLKALRRAGINVVAIHHHMTHETPRMLFVHYWAKGPAAEIARSLKSVLAVQRL